MTVTPRIVDGLILYGDQAYSEREWEERNRPRYMTPEAKERRRTYNREYRLRHRERINRSNREWMARHRSPRLLIGAAPRLVGSLHSLACTGPIKATGCRCHKVRVYDKPSRPSLRALVRE